jgi:hypothetical protein
MTQKIILFKNYHSDIYFTTDGLSPGCGARVFSPPYYTVTVTVVEWHTVWREDGSILSVSRVQNKQLANLKELSSACPFT